MAFVGRETRCEHCLFSDRGLSGVSLAQLRLSRAASRLQFIGQGRFLLIYRLFLRCNALGIVLDK